MMESTLSEANSSRRLNAGAPRRILILRALQLGDLLCAVPAWRALRTALPEAKIVLVGLPWAEQVVSRFSRYLDGFIEFPGYPGLPERSPNLPVIPEFLAAVQRDRFDLAIQMHGSGSIVNPLAVLFGADRTAGFYAPGEYCPDPELFMPYPEEEPEVWRHLSLVEFLGFPAQGDELEFPLTRQDEEELTEIGESRWLEPGSYVCVHPGSRSQDRRWNAAQFAAAADVLAEKGLRVVLTGTASEQKVTTAVAAAMRRPAIDLAGRTSLGALGALLNNARLLLSNDTGVSHIASALQVPSVVVFTGSDPGRWAPLDRDLHRVVDGRRSDYRAALDQAEDLLAGELVHV